jgi:hypothetical protein
LGALHTAIGNMSSDSKLQKPPLEISIQIAGYLNAHDLVNASASCKFFYTCFANQTIWEAAYGKLLNGYPVDHFVITDVVKHAKRPNFVHFHSTQDPHVDWLVDWRTSWKQRTVFVLHVLNIQRQLVTIAQQQTQVFKPAKVAPLYDSNYILRMEQYVGAIFPIDFVLFLQNFAQCVTLVIDPSDHPSFPMAALASGSIFESEQRWRRSVHTSHFAEFNVGDTEQHQLARTQDLTDHTLEYLNQMKSVCFSVPRVIDEFWDGIDYLSLVLDIDSSLRGQIPPIVTNDLIYVHFASMENGIGKVAHNHLNRDISYQYRCISESFTDYFIQYIAVIIKLGGLPTGDMDGYSNLVSPLPRFPGLPKSVLLPQHKGWNVANYSPVYISNQREPCFPLTASDHIRTGAKFQWDSHLPDLPNNMIGGFSMAWWEPYSVPEIIQNGRIPTSFIELKDREMPKPKSRQITADIYRIQQQMIQDWLASATSKSL